MLEPLPSTSWSGEMEDKSNKCQQGNPAVPRLTCQPGGVLHAALLLLLLGQRTAAIDKPAAAGRCCCASPNLPPASAPLPRCRAVESMGDYRRSFALFPPIYLAMFLIRHAALLGFPAARLYCHGAPVEQCCCRTSAAALPNEAATAAAIVGACAFSASIRCSTCWAAKPCRCGQLPLPPGVG